MQNEDPWVQNPQLTATLAFSISCCCNNETLGNTKSTRDFQSSFLKPYNDQLCSSELGSEINSPVRVENLIKLSNSPITPSFLEFYITLSIRSSDPYAAHFEYTFENLCTNLEQLPNWHNCTSHLILSKKQTRPFPLAVHLLVTCSFLRKTISTWF